MEHGHSETTTAKNRERVMGSRCQWRRTDIGVNTDNVSPWRVVLRKTTVVTVMAADEEAAVKLAQDIADDKDGPRAWELYDIRES